jgi:UDP-3-O-[3-hydroxymyristoyl] N-acetylglucosamine deacetylase
LIKLKLELTMKQKTIQQSIFLEGVGLHSGEIVKMVLKPAAEDAGIVFRRVDLSPFVDIKVTPKNVEEAVMCTLLSNGKEGVSTIEHLMSALCVFEIDNVLIEIDGAEVPVMDGSSIKFVDALEQCGSIEQNKKRRVIKILDTIRVEDGDKFAEVSPSETTKYRFEIDFDHPVISATPSGAVFSGEVEYYKNNIAEARTFGYVEELEYLKANNLGKGASLDNAIGVSKQSVLNDGGLRYPDEFVKHKLLDAIGDFYVGGAILGNFNCYKSGHKLNNKLLLALLENTDLWTIT